MRSGRSRWIFSGPLPTLGTLRAVLALETPGLIAALETLGLVAALETLRLIPALEAHRLIPLGSLDAGGALGTFCAIRTVVADPGLAGHPAVAGVRRTPGVPALAVVAGGPARPLGPVRAGVRLPGRTDVTLVVGGLRGRGRPAARPDAHVRAGLRFDCGVRPPRRRGLWPRLARSADDQRFLAVPSPRTDLGDISSHFLSARRRTLVQARQRPNLNGGGKTNLAAPASWRALISPATNGNREGSTLSARTGRPK